jgi:hypothetical protein
MGMMLLVKVEALPKELLEMLTVKPSMSEPITAAEVRAA